MAYKLRLPMGVKIHPVFHVSVLKPCHGDPDTAALPLPQLTADYRPLIQPTYILQARSVIQQGQPHVQVLIHWDGLSSADNSWENFSHLQHQFPHLDLEDKVLNDGGVM